LWEFLVEIVFRGILEAIFGGIFYLLKQAWFRITGQSGKARQSSTKRRNAQQARCARLEQIRRRRGRKR
jgi:hypothetical protein